MSSTVVDFCSGVAGVSNRLISNNGCTGGMANQQMQARAIKKKILKMAMIPAAPGTHLTFEPLQLSSPNAVKVKT
jgi:hypothetical protein